MSTPKERSALPDSKDWSLKQLAKYPFLEEAREYIKENGPPLTELINDRAWGMVRQRGKERVIEAIKEGGVEAMPLKEKVEQKIELYSYPIARILVSAVSDSYLTRRYALGEAGRVSDELKREETELVLAIGDVLGLPGETEDGKVKLSFVDYLENTGNLRSPRWKFVNQDVRDGFVYLPPGRYIRVLKERITQDILDKLPRPVNDMIMDVFESQVEEIEGVLEESREEFEPMDLGRVETDLFPPCMKKIMALQKEGVNLSHEARFALTAFLHTVGLNEDDIMNLFSEAPDFDADLARYQIEHIIGEISGTEYSPPGCELMKTNGVCYEPDGLCEQDWMEHPLTYYYVKKKGEKEGKVAKEG